MEKEKHRTDGIRKKRRDDNGCLKRFMWIFLCSAGIVVISCTMGFTLFTLSSYRQTVALLEKRIERLENSNRDFESVENIVNRRVADALKQVL